jgi:gliding motility-associated-like protein
MILTDACETPAATACWEVIVETPLVPTFAADTTQGCAPAVMQFEILNDPATYTDVFWILGEGTGTDVVDPFGVYEAPGLYTVELQLTSPAGCEYTSVYPNYIQIFTNPVAGFTADPQPTTMPDTEISFFDLSIGSVVAWDWEFDLVSNMGASTEQNPVFEFPIDVGGEYPVRLTVTDANGCTDQITRIIVINDLLNIYIPNSFTPNNDGLNDVFYVLGTDVDPDRFEIQVFDRWGGIVYESTDINDVWDGSVSGGAYYAQNEVYVWRAVVHSLSTAERVELNGTVTLLR